MDLLRAAILGIIQGLAEFLPISSSGHLILVPALFNWEDQGLAFDVGLHCGTLLVLLAYFWRDWARMITGGLRDLFQHRLRFADHSGESRLLWLIAFGSIPAGVVGLLFNDWIEENVRQPWVVAITLAAFGIVMLLADRRTSNRRTMEGIGLADAAFIGLAQAAALIPGVSRSGATLCAGLFRDIRRDDAARFAFLLGTPAFVGAAALTARDLTGLSGREGVELAIGFAMSAAVGFAVIHFLLRYLRTRTLLPFVLYRFAIAAVTLIIGGIRIAF